MGNNLLTELPLAVWDSAVQMVADAPEETLVGYTAVTGPDPDNAGRVVPIAWNVITSNGVYEITPDGYVVRAKAVHAFGSYDL